MPSLLQAKFARQRDDKQQRGGYASPEAPTSRASTARKEQRAALVEESWRKLAAETIARIHTPAQPIARFFLGRRAKYRVPGDGCLQRQKPRLSMAGGDQLGP